MDKLTNKDVFDPTSFVTLQERGKVILAGWTTLTLDIGVNRGHLENCGLVADTFSQNVM